MNSNVNLVCIAPDGNYVTAERDLSVEEASDVSANMGSRWFFYPYHILTSLSNITIKQCDWAPQYNGRRLTTLIKDMKNASANYHMD